LRESVIAAARRVPAEGCLSALKATGLRRRLKPSSAPSPWQRPERVDRCGIQADLVELSCLWRAPLKRARRLVGAFDEQALGGHAPEEVVVLERGDERSGLGVVKADRRVGFGVFVNDAVDAAVLFVAQRRFIIAAPAGGETLPAWGCAGR